MYAIFFLAFALTADPGDKTAPAYDVPLVQYDAAHCHVLGLLAVEMAENRRHGVTLREAIAREDASFPRAVHSWGPQLARLVYGEGLGGRRAYGRVMGACRTMVK